MATNAEQFAHLSDQDLVAAVGRLAHSERCATAALIASLVEFDGRRLYLPEGFPSLFAYCTQHLHLSEHAAYHRIEAARAARRFRVVLDLLEEGALTLTAVGLLRPHLTDENHREVLEAARFRGKRAVEDVVARLQPRPDVRASIRKLPPPRTTAPVGQMVAVSGDDRAVVSTLSAALSATGGVGGGGATSGERAATQLRGVGLLRESAGDGEVVPGPGGVGRSGGVASDEQAAAQPTAAGLPGAPASDGEVVCIASGPRPAVIRASAPERYQVQMTVSAETHAKLRHAQELLRHVVPNGDPAVIFDRALTLLVEELERRKCAALKERPLKKPSLEKASLMQPSGSSREGSSTGGTACTPPGRREADSRRGRRRRGVRTTGRGLAAGSGAAGIRAAALDAEGSGAVAFSAVPTQHPLASADARGSAGRSRTIPAAVKRAVWARDGGRCAFVGTAGRCPERGFLEYHHEIPFAAGGEATVANVSMRCRSHNNHEAERFFAPGSRHGRQEFSRSGPS